MPNSITLAGSGLVRSRLPTSFDPDSVMEFGFKACAVGRTQQAATDDTVGFMTSQQP